jgi:hypothetical protein
MHVLAATALILTPLAAADSASLEPAQPFLTATGATPDRCDPHGRVQRTDAPQAMRAVPLTELPPGNLDLAVMRQVGGCPEPVTIRQNFGAVAPEGPAKAPAPPPRPRARLLPAN